MYPPSPSSAPRRMWSMPPAHTVCGARPRHENFTSDTEERSAAVAAPDVPVITFPSAALGRGRRTVNASAHARSTAAVMRGMLARAGSTARAHCPGYTSMANGPQPGLGCRGRPVRVRE